MIKYRKKPVVIEAVQWDGSQDGWQQLLKWAGRYNPPTGHSSPHWIIVHIAHNPVTVTVHTLEGAMTVSPDDWVIKGVADEFYPCKPEIFEQTYELAE